MSGKLWPATANHPARALWLEAPGKAIPHHHRFWWGAGAAALARQEVRTFPDFLLAEGRAYFSCLAWANVQLWSIGLGCGPADPLPPEHLRGMACGRPSELHKLTPDLGLMDADCRQVLIRTPERHHDALFDTLLCLAVPDARLDAPLWPDPGAKATALPEEAILAARMAAGPPWDFDCLPAARDALEEAGWPPSWGMMHLEGKLPCDECYGTGWVKPHQERWLVGEDRTPISFWTGGTWRSDRCGPCDGKGWRVRTGPHALGCRFAAALASQPVRGEAGPRWCPGAWTEPLPRKQKAGRTDRRDAWRR